MFQIRSSMPGARPFDPAAIGRSLCFKTILRARCETMRSYIQRAYQIMLNRMMPEKSFVSVCAMPYALVVFHVIALHVRWLCMMRQTHAASSRECWHFKP
jgi:hypothetical protein